MELQVIRKLIKDNITEHSEFITKAQVAERYYRNKNDILYRKKEEDNDNPLRNADNRIPSNFHGLLVNQKSSYMFTAPPLFDLGDKQTNDKVVEVLGDSYAKACKDLCINASNCGVAWLHLWVDEEQKLQYGLVDSKQIIPLWSSNLSKSLLAVLRIYDNIDEEGKKYNIYEYWTDKACYAFRKEFDKSLEEGLSIYNMFSVINHDEGTVIETNSYEHGFGEVPFIPFYNNNIQTSDLNNTKPLVDVYDKVFSGFVNDLEDIQEIIFVLTNYSGTDADEFIKDLKRHKFIKVESTGADDKSGLNTLTIDIPVEAREKLLTMTRKAIFEQGQGVDPDPQSFGNASGVALKYLYSLLELKSGLMETEFKLGFGRLIRMVCKYLNIQVGTIIQTWTRTSITNDTELADIATKSVGVISRGTILKNHPWVEDAEAEEKQLKLETKDDEGDSYPNFPKEGEVDEE